MGQRDTEKMVRVIGGRFELGELIGHGGMGDVYRGFDTRTGETVAIKALKPMLMAEGTRLVERFAREGEVLRRLDHPSIVKVLATIEEQGRPFIVMEYVGGGSLDDLLATEGPLPLLLTLEIALDLADALTRAHRLHVIHRDIKPGNVLIACDGRPRLTDFGVAYITDLDESISSRVTQPGSIIGTVAYLSPEACRGQMVDVRTDIWSFGVMLYEMLTGQLPFSSKQTAQILVSILTESIPDLTQFRSDLPSSLVGLIDQMLQKNVGRRLPSMRLVGMGLESILNELKSITPPDGGLHVPVIDTSRFAAAATTNKLGPPHNLPDQPSIFVGRDEELADVCGRLQTPECRLLSLVGPGGMGKTRLALRAADELLPNFMHGVFFVPLAPVESVDFLVPTIAGQLNFSFYGDQDLKQQLLGFLRTKHMLLLLDNFEHLLEGAGLVAEILFHAPDVKVLVTSRERLNLREEWMVNLRGMALPDQTMEIDPDALVDCGAVQLFSYSARRALPGFTLSEEEIPYVLHICRLVDGMPLGIELAAAWVRVLRCEEICAEIEAGLDFLSSPLRNVSPRHQSLRAVFEYSWNLLSSAEQDVLGRLAVFRGGFRRDAASRVARTSLSILTSLVDKSLLRRSFAGYYEIHGLLRQFAAEKLAETPHAEETHMHHCAYYAAFLAMQEARLKGRRQKQALLELETEIENVRAAWRWAIAHRCYAEIDRALDGLYLFYDMTGRILELDTALRDVLDMLETAPDQERLLGRALARLGGTCFYLSRFNEAKAVLERGLRLLETYGDEQDLAAAYSYLGSVSRMVGDYEAAQQFHEQALALSEQCVDRWHVAYVLNNLGFLANASGDYETAWRRCEESLAIRRALDDSFGAAETLKVLGDIAYNLGDYEEAKRILQESVEIYRSVDYHWGTAFSLQALGDVVRELGEHREARTIFDEAYTIFNELGGRVGAEVALVNLGRIAYEMGEYAESKIRCQESLAICREIGLYWGVAFALYHLGRARFALGEYEEAEANFREALKVARAVRVEPLIMYVSLGVAMGLMHRRDPRAFELLTLILHHPSSNCETQDEARRLLDELDEIIYSYAARFAAEPALRTFETVVDELLAGS